MSELISEERFSCPFCAEPITIVVDFSAGSQTYIEDCQVCCQPMGVVVGVGADGQQSVRVERAS
jgi:transcription elongation factor Elf1